METEIYPGKINPFDPSTSGGGDDDNEYIHMTSTLTRRSSEDVTHEETSFIENVDDRTPLFQRERNMDNAFDRIKSYKFPNVKTINSSFTAVVDEFDRVMVKLKSLRDTYHPLFNEDDELNEYLPKTVKKSLGPPAVEVVSHNEEISSLEN